MKIKRIALLAPAAATLALAACGGSPDEEQPAPETSIDNLTVPEPANMVELPEEAPPATRIDNTAAEALPEPTPEIVSPEQTQDDAAATGMTARISRDEPGNGAQPAE